MIFVNLLFDHIEQLELSLQPSTLYLYLKTLFIFHLIAE